MKLVHKASVASVLVAVLGLTGCANLQTLPEEYHEWAFTQARTTDIPASAHLALEDGRQGDRLALGSTPWGEQTFFTVSERYFSASGRPCFRGQLEYEEDIENAVVCRYGPRRWVATRAIAQEINVVDHAELNR